MLQVRPTQGVIRAWMELSHFYCVKTLPPGILGVLFHVFRFAKSREIGGQRWNRTGPHPAPTRGFSD